MIDLSFGGKKYGKVWVLCLLGAAVCLGYVYGQDPPAWLGGAND